MSEPQSELRIEMTINGRRQAGLCEARKSLGDFLREDAGYTGVHLGCEHGVCGACTVIVDGAAVRSCLMLAVQADGSEITTVEGLAAPDGTFHPVQAAIGAGGPRPSEDEMLAAMSGHICRCTGYQGIRRAITRLATEGASA